MIIRKTDLQRALQLCMPGIEKGDTILSGADTFVFQDGLIHSYNDVISVSVPFQIPVDEVPLSGAVKATEFFRLISKMPAEEIELAITDGVWNMKSASVSIELSLMDMAVIEHIQGIAAEGEWQPVPAQFNSGLQACKFSSNRSALSGVYVNGTYMMSTDEMRINQYNFQGLMEPFWIPDSSANELSKFNNLVEYRVISSWVQFRTGEGVMFSCKRLQHEKFPYEKILTLIKSHDQTPEDVTFELPDKLKESAERAATFAMDIDSFKAIRLTFTQANIEVHSEKSSGKFTEKVAWDKPVEKPFEPVTIYLDYKYVEYGLFRTKNMYIKQTQKGETVMKRLIFQGDSLTHLVSTVQP